MKRIRKMTSLQEVTEKMVRENRGGALEHSLLQGLPARVFGETVAQKISEMRLDGNTLILYITDPAWRLELEKRRLSLLECARSLRPDIRWITLAPADSRKA